MTKRITYVLAAALAVLAGCSQQQSPTSPDVTAIPATDGGSNQGLALANQVQSAQLHLFVGFANGQAVDLHQIIADWEPATTTWNQFGGAYNSAVEGSFVAVGSGWFEVDVTALVQRWVAGEADNFGLLLAQATPGVVPNTIASSESSTLSPFLEVCYLGSSVPACDTLRPAADVFIDQAQPDVSSEGTGTLMVGQALTPGQEKLALVRFDLIDLLAQAEPVTVAGWVWEDTDQNGIDDAGESGLADVAVRLLDCSEALLEETITDAAGAYVFDSLTAGSFIVEFVPPTGYEFSPMDREPTDSLDSDADPSTGRTLCFTLAEGETAPYVAAGMFVPVVTDSGCTHGKGYWKNHAGGLRPTDEVSPLLPIWLGDAGGAYSLLVDRPEIAVEVLSQKTYGTPSNGITKLYAHLLAAKLNIAAGALPDAVGDVIAKADEFLAEHDQTAWSTLDQTDKASLLQWKDMLERFNEGEIGPGSCD